jgi:tetratricopeptide (TPR) repeat protein
MLTEPEATTIVNSAELCNKRGNPRDALRLLRQLQEAIQTGNEPWVASVGVQMYYLGSTIHDNLGLSHESRAFLLSLVRWLRRAVSYSTAKLKSVAEPTLAASEAKLLCEEGQIEQSIACYRSSLAYLEGSQPQANEWELGVRCEFVSILSKTNRFTEVRSVVRLAHSRSRDTEPSERLAVLSIAQGNAALVDGDLEGAESAYQKAHDISKALNDPVRQAIAMERISLAHRHAMEVLKLPPASLDRSISARRCAVSLYQRAGDENREREARTQLVNDLVYARRADEALRECATAAERCETLNDFGGACSFAAHAGYVAASLGRREDAVSLYRHAIQRYGNSVPNELVDRVRDALNSL